MHNPLHQEQQMNAGQAIRLGYFVPEFPAQTHAFFWRELRSLAKPHHSSNGSINVVCDLVSTRKPVASIVSHEWATEAQSKTTYLYPPGKNLFGAAREILRAGPLALIRCVKAIVVADVVFSQRLRLCMLLVFGAQLARLARIKQWDHLHVHSCADSANIALFASLLSGLSYSITLHGPLRDYGPNQRQKWKHASFAIVITQLLLQEVQQLLKGSLPPRVALAPMGVEINAFRRSAAYSPWQPGETCRLFSCGRLNVCKGHADVIAAVQILKMRGMAVKLEIAGQDESGGTGYAKTLHELVRNLGLENEVQLLGAVSEQRIKESLENAHIFVLASLAEPLGVAIMEAMAMEVPVVVTRGGGVTELVESGKQGILIDPRNPEQIANAVETLLESKSLKEFGKRGRERVETAFHSDMSAQVLVQALTDLHEQRNKTHKV